MGKSILAKLSFRELNNSFRKGKGLMPSRPFKDKSKYNRKNKHRKDYE